MHAIAKLSRFWTIDQLIGAIISHKILIMEGAEASEDPSEGEKAIEISIGPEIDLHTFPPKHVGEIVEAYVEECSRLNIERVRIVHGKGVGNLRRTVHSVLSKSPHVQSFGLASEAEGSWGATIAFIQSNNDG